MEINGGQTAINAPESNVTITIDGFHDGAFELLQLKKNEHRCGHDALLLAAFLPENSRGKLADLGTGTGAAGFASAHLFPGLDVLLVERKPNLAELLHKSIALPINHALSARLSVLVADVTLSGHQRSRAGLRPDQFDCVIANPPYNDHSHRIPSNAERAESYMMLETELESWVRTAVAILKPGGIFLPDIPHNRTG